MSQTASSFRPQGLVVDDDASMRRALKRLLEGLGMQSVAVPDVAEAIAHLKREQVDFLLTDLEMPGGDGLKLLAWVQQWQPELPAALISGKLSPAVVEEAGKLGAKGCMGKPFKLPELKTLLAAMGILPLAPASLPADPPQ